MELQNVVMCVKFSYYYTLHFHEDSTIFSIFYFQVDAFVSWLEGEEKKLELHIQTKKPIGIIQSELETFYVRKTPNLVLTE